MGIGLGGTDGKTCGFGDFAESEIERVLQCYDGCLCPWEFSEARSKFAPGLGCSSGDSRVAIDGAPVIGFERFCAPCLPCLREVLARVHDQAVQPRRELRFAAVLAESHDDFCESVLARIPRIFGIAQQMKRKALHSRLVADAEHLKRGTIAILRSPHENWVGETVEVETG